MVTGMKGEKIEAPVLCEYIYNELYIQQVPFGNRFSYDSNVI
jgi:hypothetical protein